MLTLLIGLSSCGEEVDVTSDALDDPKARWLEGKPCVPPCWESIQPGITRPEDAVELLKANPIVNPTSVYIEENQEMDGGLITWAFADESISWSGRSIYRLNKQSITAISLTTPDLCLDEIIGAYGEPDYLYLRAYQVIDVVDLIWQSYGFIYENRLASPSEGIAEATCGGRIVQFPVGTAFQNIPTPDFMAASEDDFVPWTGYGRYGK